jgi:hypothetical protein
MLKMLKIYFIAMLLMTGMCVPAFAANSRRQSDTFEKEIRKSVAAIGRTGKETGKIIGKNVKEIGKQTGKVFKDMARTLKDTAQKESK